ncbi:MAG: 3-deoxy-7-phosphoheptulonate synthase [endosymbiont of Galathealinum brachiosum]|uniref:Phospho-2-dehydro-3-deoxyheptonate aldolase n=1 Tax=endosymbiont of Galathealinum brachiosum TaxID=2200906 RepID=A0A370DHM6_9GAMM|nr:MAG: 3-deoxy-7-phosphoheptulonate synthase [endosymbiont of Galathealinum brachiosum]
MKYKTDDLRISGLQEVLPPEELHREYPLTDAASDTVHSARQAIHDILQGESDRLLVIVGPCSIHDTKAGREYANLLKPLIDELADDLCIVMRIYFEKPRTTVGWKGLINDPHLDDSFNINHGLRQARSLLLDIADMGIPAGTEYLDLISPQYVSDLVSWGAIGARTTESQGHRELASGLSCPVGFKNGTDGGLKVAVDAIQAASRPHVFMSLTKQGHSAIFSTTGNEDCHIILRGGKTPNYDAKSVKDAVDQLQSSEQNTKLMIDCSHANSEKDHNRQLDVCRDVAGQVKAGNGDIMGVMLESHLVAGRQNVENIEDLTYGQSITDACIAWNETEVLLRELAEAVRDRRKG